MPYTLAHPAAVLPLLRRGPLVTSGLVAGSMAPDVPYFTGTVAPRTFAFGEFTHSLLGVVTADVLLAAVLALPWRGVRAPLVRLLPAVLAGRAETLTRPRRASSYPGWFVVSAAFGSLTHVLWDDFTHPGRLGVRLIPVLGHVVGGHPIYQLLQYASSVLGIAALVWWGARLLRSAAPMPVELAPGRQVARALGAFALLWGAAAGVRHGQAGGYTSVFDFVPTLLFYTGSAVVCWAVGYAGALRLVGVIGASRGPTRMRDRDGEPGFQRDGRHDAPRDRTAV